LHLEDILNKAGALLLYVNGTNELTAEGKYQKNLLRINDQRGSDINS
jgi:hypothetical protein